MVDSIIRIVIFIILLALGGYFVVIFHRKHSSILTGGVDCSKYIKKDIHIVSKLPIGCRQFLSVVKCGEQMFLVGISPGRIDTIGEIKSQCNIDANSMSPVQEVNKTCSL